jgi:hypothetical protein
METKVSLACLQKASNSPYPEPHQSSSYLAIISNILFNIIDSPTVWSSYWSLSFWFSHRYLICIPLLPIRTTLPVHYIILDLILITLGEEYKSWSSSMCSYLQPPLSSSLFVPNILHHILFSNTFSVGYSLNVTDKVSQLVALSVLIFTFFKEQTKRRDRDDRTGDHIMYKHNSEHRDTNNHYRHCTQNLW